MISEKGQENIHLRCFVSAVYRVFTVTPEGFLRDIHPDSPSPHIFCHNSPMRNLTATLCLTVAVLLMVSTPVISADLHKAQTPPSQQKNPEDMIEDGMKMILNALQLILKSIPQYKAPEVLENGDIIIRRVPSGEKKPKSGDETQKET